MKTNRVVLFAILTTFLTFPVLGQYEPPLDPLLPGKEAKKMSMDKPTFESTVEGTHVKVWIMSHSDHQKMMDAKHAKEKIETPPSGTAPKSETQGMSQEGKQAMTEMRTHHIMVEAADAKTGVSLSKAPDAATAKSKTQATCSVVIVSPSNKTVTVDLAQMANHFGAGVDLLEKGKYHCTLSLKVDGATKVAQFDYTPAAAQAMDED